MNKGVKKWINQDYGHEYYQLQRDSGFYLCQVNGSLSSVLVYADREHAIKNGWMIKPIEINNENKGEVLNE